ncbi:hypothetical protein EON63_17900 [archaeon]|nr:MAG: hypothetical protein EON63_17900 [archaeon]
MCNTRVYVVCMQCVWMRYADEKSTSHTHLCAGMCMSISYAYPCMCMSMCMCIEHVCMCICADGYIPLVSIIVVC